MEARGKFNVRGVVGVANIDGRDEIEPVFGVPAVGREALGGGVRRSSPIVLLQVDNVR